MLGLAQGNYYIGKGFTAVASGLNLNNAAFGFYMGSSQYFIQREYYKPTYTFGLRWELQHENDWAVIIGVAVRDTRDHQSHDRFRQRAGRPNHTRSPSAYPGTELHNYGVQHGFLVTSRNMVDEGGHQLAHISYPGLPADEMPAALHRSNDEYYFRPKAVFRILKRAVFSSPSASASTKKPNRFSEYAR